MSRRLSNCDLNAIGATPEEPDSPVDDLRTGDDGMITVRAHNKKTGEITVMRVKRGTPMREVMASYASNSVWESNLRRVRRVVFHAIAATPARWRGDAGSCTRRSG